MVNFKKSIAFISAVTLCTCACVSDFNLFGINSENVVYASEFENYQDKVIELVNAEREKEGLQPLYTSDLLNSLGQIRAEELLEDFSHTRPDGTKGMKIIDGYDISYSYCGENIAAGSSNPEDVIELWMNSDGHRANILKDAYTHMGVGVVYDENSEYGFYWVQIFYGINGNIDGQYIPMSEIETTTTTEETTISETTTTTEETTTSETTTPETTTIVTTASTSEESEHKVVFSIENKVVTLDEAKNQISVLVSIDKYLACTALEFDFDESLNLVKINQYPNLEGITDETLISFSGNEFNGCAAYAISGGYIKGNIIELVFTVDNPEAGAKYDISCTNYNPVCIYPEKDFSNIEVDNVVFENGCIQIAGDFEVTTTTETEQTSVTTEYPFPEPTVSGDTSGDDSVDIRDVTYFNQYLIKQMDMNLEQMANADVIKDGVIDISDLGQIKKYIIKLIDKL